MAVCSVYTAGLWFPAFKSSLPTTYACIMHTYCNIHTQYNTKIKFEVEGEHVWCNLSMKDTLKTVRVTSLMRTLSADPKPHRVVYKSTSELGTPSSLIRTARWVPWVSSTDKHFRCTQSNRYDCTQIMHNYVCMYVCMHVYN